MSAPLNAGVCEEVPKSPRRRGHERVTGPSISPTDPAIAVFAGRWERLASRGQKTLCPSGGPGDHDSLSAASAAVSRPRTTPSSLSALPASGNR